MNWGENIKEAIALFDVDIPAEALDVLDAYIRLVVDGCRKMNLVSFSDEKELALRHVADSLACLPSLPDGPVRCVDVGSGAGFPGLPVAVARPDLSVTLLESVGKKADFLCDAARFLGLGNVDVVCARAETVGQSDAGRESWDVALSRAAGKLPVVLEYCLPLVRVGGTAVFFLGGVCVGNLEEMLSVPAGVLGGRLGGNRAYRLEKDGKERMIVSVDKVSRTPDEYPRRPGVPKKRPIAAIGRIET